MRSKKVAGIVVPVELFEAELAKGGTVPMELGLALGGELREFNLGGEACDWRPLGPKLGVLRVKLAKADKWLSIMANTLSEARTLALQGLEDLRAGRAPRRGVLRRPGDLPARSA